MNRVLICAQVSLTLVLIIGATLLVKSLQNLRSVDPGFRREGVLVMQLFPQPGRQAIPNRTTYYRELANTVSQIPGVQSVSYSHYGPVMGHEFTTGVSISSSEAQPVQAMPDIVGPGFAFYRSLTQEPGYNHLKIDIRVAGDPGKLAASARETIEALGHHYPLHIETLAERSSRFLRQEQMLAGLAAFFGSLVLLLASIGLYGVVSYAVTRRTSEIGLRMALGAEPGSTVRLILREVTGLLILGVTAGLLLAVAASQLVSGMLFGLSSRDSTMFALSAAILMGIGLLSAYLPARRAARVDPLVALKYE